MKKFLLISLIVFSVSAKSMSDCAQQEDFKTSTYGILKTALLPINISFPERDAQLNFENGDYRFLGFGDYGGIKIPGSDSLKDNEICAYGVRIFPGLTDAYESSEHRVLAEKVRNYSKKYNAFLLILLGAKTPD